MIIHYNCTIGSISFLLICHPYPSSFHEMIFILVIYSLCVIHVIVGILAGSRAKEGCPLSFDPIPFNLDKIHFWLKCCVLVAYMYMYTWTVHVHVCIEYSVSDLVFLQGTCVHVHSLSLSFFLSLTSLTLTLSHSLSHSLSLSFSLPLSLFLLSQVNPVRRITIQGIREHPWFTVDLLDYLFPLGDPGATQMDSLALSEVCQKLGVPPQEVVAAVRGGELYTVCTGPMIVCTASKAPCVYSRVYI